MLVVLQRASEVLWELFNSGKYTPIEYDKFTEEYTKYLDKWYLDKEKFGVELANRLLEDSITSLEEDLVENKGIFHKCSQESGININ